MDSFAIDLAPEQIVAWLGDEQGRGGAGLEIRATRSFVPGDVGEAGVGEDVDLSAVTAEGLLEVWPAAAPKDWCVRIRAEDVLGEHLAEDHLVDEAGETIDLATFERLFVAPGSATLDAVLMAETGDARRRGEAVLARMMSDRHGA